MKWTILLAIAAAIGGVLFAAHRKSQRETAEAALWAEATDPIGRA